LVCDDPRWCRSARDLLVRLGHTVAATPEALDAGESAERRPPAIAVVDFDMPGRAPWHATTAIRKAAPDCALLLLTRQHPDRHAQALHRFAPAAVLERDLSLADAVERVLTAPDSSNQINTQSLDLLVGLWQARKSGILISSDGTTRLGFGAPIDSDGLAFARASIFLPGELRYAESASRGAGDHDAFGRVLFQAARGPGSERFLAQHRNRAIGMVDRERLRAMTLHPDTLRLVDQATGEPLLAAAKARDLAQEPVSKDLAALVRMGLIQLRHAYRDVQVEVPPVRAPKPTFPKARPPAQAPKPVAAPPPPAPKAPPVEAPPRRPRRPRQTGHGARKRTGPPPQDPARLLKRLRTELDRLGDANCWIVLGVAATHDVAKIEASADRLVMRYQAVSEDHSLPEPVRGAGTALLKLVETARAVALTNPHETVLRTEGVSRDQQAFDQGRRAFESKQWDRAVRLLKVAHKLSQFDARYAAWLGAALRREAELLPTEQAVKNREQGAELLGLADSLDDTIPEAQLWLAELEIEDQKLEVAGARLRRLQRRGHNDGVPEMLARLEEATAQTRDA
jgi:CheY-like chemotaxis protein